MVTLRGNKSNSEILCVMFLVNMYMYAPPVFLYSTTIWNILDIVLFVYWFLSLS